MTWRGLLAGVGLVFALLAGLVVFGAGGSDPALDPATPGAGVSAFLVSNGFHSGLILPRPELARAAAEGRWPSVLAVATRFGHYDWIEVGWGDERFYRDVPEVAPLNWRLGLRALFWPGNTSVMHVVGVEGDPHGLFRGADLVALTFSSPGFARLVRRLDASFARDALGLPQEVGPGLYGPSLFYRATGTFSILNVCNHWTARLLGSAGIPVSPLLATLPRGLLLDLRFRSHLRPEREALSAGAGVQ